MRHEPPSRLAKPADYHGGSIVNLAASIARSFDWPGPPDGRAIAASLTSHAATVLPALARSQTVITVLLDGVGERQLRDHVPAGFLSAHRLGALTSTFPSATAPAITSLLSATAPAAHGNPGWFMHEPVTGRIIRTLPMDVRGGNGGPVSADCWHWQPWSANAQGRFLAMQPADIADSTFSRHAFAGCERRGYRRLEEIGPVLTAFAREGGPLRRHAWVYAPHFDSVAHDTGCRSDAARTCLGNLDRWVRHLAQSVAGSDTVLLITADHGFVDIAPAGQHRLDTWPELAACLALPLTGEPRVVYCHVRPERIAQFDAISGDVFAGICDVWPSADLLAAGWFGPEVGADFVDRLGQRTLVMREGHMLVDHLPGERRHTQIGMHSGHDLDEMQVPLIMVDGEHC